MWPIAHSGHTLVTVAYVAPVVGVLLWLGITWLRDRGASHEERSGER